MWRRALLWFVLLCILLTACSGSRTGEEILRSAIERWQKIESYQLEAEILINGEHFSVRQWFLEPDMLRSVITNGSKLEYILITNPDGVWVYNSQVKLWSSITEDNPYPIFASSSLLALMNSLVAPDMKLSENLSTIKISFRGVEHWDYGEITLCRKRLNPEKIVLVHRDTEIVLNVNSFVGNLNLTPDIFLPGQ